MDIEELMQTKEFQAVVALPDELINAMAPIERDLARGCKALAKNKGVAAI